MTAISRLEDIALRLIERRQSAQLPTLDEMQEFGEAVGQVRAIFYALPAADGT